MVEYNTESRCNLYIDGDDVLSYIRPYREMSVYCTCGRIVALDRAEMEIKIRLGKQLQCMQCRNIRIGLEIESLNNHFAGIVEEEDLF